MRSHEPDSFVLSFRKGGIILPDFVDNPRSARGVRRPNLEFRDGK